MYNEKSNRFHHIKSPRKGQFARDTKGEPSGHVTDNKERDQWKNRKTGSPHRDPNTGSPSKRRGGAVQVELIEELAATEVGEVELVEGMTT